MMHVSNPSQPKTITRKPSIHNLQQQTITRKESLKFGNKQILAAAKDQEKNVREKNPLIRFILTYINEAS